MSRWCAFLGDGDPDVHVRAVGGRPTSSSGRPGPRSHGFGLLDGPGTASGPYTVGALTAVGEVTLFNADVLRARLGTDAPDPHDRRID